MNENKIQENLQEDIKKYEETKKRIKNYPEKKFHRCAWDQCGKPASTNFLRKPIDDKEAEPVEVWLCETHATLINLEKETSGNYRAITIIDQKMGTVAQHLISLIDVLVEKGIIDKLEIPNRIKEIQKKKQETKKI